MKGRIYLMSILRRFDWWRLRCTCLRCCLRIPAWRTSIYQNQRNPHHDALVNALTRLQFPKTFLLVYDTSLVVGVLVATRRASLFQVNPSSHIRYTRSKLWGLSRQEQLIQVCPLHAPFPPPCAEYSMNSFQEGYLPPLFNNQLYVAEVGWKYCNCLLQRNRRAIQFDRCMSAFPIFQCLLSFLPGPPRCLR